MKMLAEDIEIPEVPIPLRIMLAQKKRVAALKRINRRKSLNGKKRIKSSAKK